MATPRLVRSAAYLLVSNVDTALHYYRDRLGFKVDYAAGTPVEFAIVSRDGLPLMLKLGGPSSRIEPMAARGGTWDVYFWVTGVDALHQDVTARGAMFAQPLGDQPLHGTREFAVFDPDGHVLAFGEEQC